MINCGYHHFLQRKAEGIQIPNAFCNTILFPLIYELKSRKLKM